MKERLKPSSVISFAGRKQSLTGWASDLGCTVQCLLGRFDRNWSTERALTEKACDIGGKNRGTSSAAEPLTPDEMKLLLAQCTKGPTGLRNKALIVLGWRAGLRIFEAIALKPEDLASRTIRILHGKGDKARTIGIDGEAWAVIEEWIDRRSELNLPAGSRLFCPLRGGKLSDRYVRQLMERLGKRAGIQKHVHYHGLRHTLAFDLANEGLPMHVIQQQLGHSSLAVTSRYVSHLNPLETVQRMRSRTWGNHQSEAARLHGTQPAPQWLDRLRSDIGDRLAFVHDGRKDPNDFKALVVLY